ncbi:alcohol dehydrogenase catalytic domain-containing protein [Nocardioides sp. LMS-CY]|uniref:alcohol dehydrogenase n=1 Tax=Nocardioides soli TaxID=1036020 RepID=A0A7W4VRX2_9ACTN|nr:MULTISPECIES: alcohol dehydrogenase catalytic domain-containing protein [Nocardioides]MBB3040645.1 propanol-preferring alcohol dehydrogenase [Nocardioides soli]QWF23898.1 alcohol dehydrogenase catalytic domain-containing protein [Nocardioides sp. LMS-CY]
MKAVVMQEAGTYEVAEVPEPERGDLVLVESRAAGICGTELHILDGMLEPPGYPFILGHEGAGVVTYVPEGVTNVAVGDRVAIYNFVGCGTCHWCRTGCEEVCTDPVGQLGFSSDGTFRDIVPVPAANCVKLPDNVSFEDAALLSCSGMTAVHALRLADVRFGDTVVVDGVGGVGLMVMQAAVAAGAQVIAIADSDARTPLAKDAGASSVIVLDERGYDAVADRIREATDGRGADHFFELVGTTASMLAGVRGLARRGTAVIIGYTDDELQMHPVELILSEARVIGSVAAARQDLETAVAMCARGELRAQIDTRYPIEEFGTGIERLRKREVNGRNVLTW